MDDDAGRVDHSPERRREPGGELVLGGGFQSSGRALPVPHVSGGAGLEVVPQAVGDRAQRVERGLRAVSFYQLLDARSTA